MFKNVLTAAAFTFSSIATMSTADAAGLTSTYTDVFDCPVPHERIDEFARECNGPNGYKAIFYYVEGKVDIFYAKNGKQLENGADIIHLNNTANQPYGKKHGLFGFECGMQFDKNINASVG